MTDYEDHWNEPSAKAWIRHVVTDMVPKMSDSSIVVSLHPDEGEGDVKFWVELGAAICMNKPIIVVQFMDKPISEKLRRVADEVVTMPYGVDPASSRLLAEAVARVMEGTEA